MTQQTLWDLHGTRQGFRSGCKCFKCRTYRYRVHREPDPMVDATPAREHLQQLQATGLGTRVLARKAKLSRTTILKLLRAQITLIPERQEQAILSLTAAPAPGTVIDGTATRKRLRALLTEGFTKDALSAQLRLHLSWFTRHHECVRADTAARFAWLCRRQVEE